MALEQSRGIGRRGGIIVLAQQLGQGVARARRYGWRRRSGCSRRDLLDSEFSLTKSAEGDFSN